MKKRKKSKKTRQRTAQGRGPDGEDTQARAQESGQGAGQVANEEMLVTLFVTSR